MQVHLQRILDIKYLLIFISIEKGLLRGGLIGIFYIQKKI